MGVITPEALTHFLKRGPGDFLLALEVTDLVAAFSTSSTKRVCCLCGLKRGPEDILEPLPHLFPLTEEGLPLSPLPLPLLVL